MVAFLCYNVRCQQTVKLQRIKNTYRKNALKTEIVNFMNFLPKFSMIGYVYRRAFTITIALNSIENST